MKGISVIICCYNSSKLLPPTLRHIAQQRKLENIAWELVLVDNNSNDNTVETIQNEIENNSYKIDYKIVSEPTQGLSHARKAGIKNSKYSYLVFCDDDNWLDENYLRNAFDIMESNASIGVLGGRNFATSDVDFPEWFEDAATNYAVGKQNETSGDITQRGYVWGAGSVYRREVLLSIFENKIETLLTDRKGTELSSGGDSEMCQWNIMLGLKLWYSDTLTLKHFIPQNRLSKEYYHKLYSGQGKSMDVLTVYFDYSKGKLEIPTHFACLKAIIKIVYFYLTAQKEKTAYQSKRLELYYNANINYKTNLYKVLHIAKKLSKLRNRI